MCKNEEELLENWLQRTSEFADGIIVIDDGSTDNRFKMLQSHKKVIRIITHEPGRPQEARKNRDKLFDAVREYYGEWAIILDIDEIMVVRLAGNLETTWALGYKRILEFPYVFNHAKPNQVVTYLNA